MFSSHLADADISERISALAASELPRSSKEGAMSTLMELTIVLLVCPAALAAWVDARYPSLRPTELRRTAIHLGVTGLVAFVLLRPVLLGIAMILHGNLGRIAAIAFACSVITYCAVVTLWAMRSAADLATAGRR
jgi:hypothetical protein